jgi:hypothetical protein
MGLTQPLIEIMYQVYQLGGKGAPVRKADNITTFMCLLSLNSGSLNLLDPSGPVQACKVLHVPFAYAAYLFLVIRSVFLLLCYSLCALIVANL